MSSTENMYNFINQKLGLQGLASDDRQNVLVSQHVIKYVRNNNMLNLILTLHYP